MTPDAITQVRARAEQWRTQQEAEDLIRDLIAMVAALEEEHARLKDEWEHRYNTPPWRSLERMYRETYPARDVVHADVLRWADTFIAARLGQQFGDGGSLNGPSRLGASQNIDTGGEIANLRTQVAALEQRLREYGSHKAHCQIDKPGGLSENLIVQGHTCTCGFDPSPSAPPQEGPR